MKTLLILTILLITLLIAPYNRMLKAIDSKAIAAQSPESLITPEQEPDLISIGTVAAANQGPYFVTGYLHARCPGSIAVMPLYRNAEGSQVLRKLVAEEDIRHGVLFKGNVHHAFPQFEFAMEKLTRGLHQLTSGQNNAGIRILAFAEQGECQLAEKLARYTF